MLLLSAIRCFLNKLQTPSQESTTNQLRSIADLKWSHAWVSQLRISSHVSSEAEKVKQAVKTIMTRHKVLSRSWNTESRSQLATSWPRVWMRRILSSTSKWKSSGKKRKERSRSNRWRRMLKCLYYNLLEEQRKQKMKRKLNRARIALKPKNLSVVASIFTSE